MIKCDQRAKAKCPFKKTCCDDEVAYFLEGSECDQFNQKVLSPRPTNADRFRAMSDEEQQKCVRRFWEIEDFADWLQQPAEGE